MRQKRPIVAKILCGLLVCALVAGYSLPEVSAADEEQASEKEAVLREEDKEESIEAAAEPMDESKKQMDEESKTEAEPVEESAEPAAEAALESAAKPMAVSEPAPIASVVSTGSCGEGLTYTVEEVEEGKYSLHISGTGAMTDYTSASKRPWYGTRNDRIDINIIQITLDEGVTRIGRHAFSSCVLVEKITIPNSVTSIGEMAFGSCTGLMKIDFSDNLNSIEKTAFQNCPGLTTIEFPDSLRSIGSNAFNRCTGLEEIILPENLESTGDGVFMKNPGLKRVEIPGGSTEWGEGIFAQCENLSEVKLGEGMKSIPIKMFLNCTSLSEIEIPASVTEIGERAFEGCNLSKVKLGEGMKSVPQDMFSGFVSLTEIEIPASMTRFGVRAFKDCTNLKTIRFGGNPDEWEELVEAAKTWPGNEALYADDVSVICAEEGKYRLTILRDFDGINQTAEAGGESITSSDMEEVFMYVPAGGTVTYSATLKEAEPSLYRIDGVIDYRSSIMNPDYMIDYLDWKAGKRTFEMPARNLEVKATKVLSACGNTWSPDDLLWDIDRIDGGDSLKLIITGSGEMDRDSAAQSNHWGWHRWKNQISEVSLPEGLSFIGLNAFSLCTSLSKVEIPDSVRGIGYHAFYSSGLTEVAVPGIALCPTGVFGEFGPASQELGEESFAESKLLEKVEILDSGVSLRLGEGIFSGCTGLKEVILPNTITNMPKNVFYEVPPLETVYFRGTKEEAQEFLKHVTPEGNEALLSAKKIVYLYGWPEVTGSETNTDGSVTVTVSSIGSGDTFTEGELSEVTVDGKTVDSANYTLTGGKLTFLSSYMDTLKEGAHEIVLKYADGKEAAATITVTKTSSVNPQPGPGTQGGTGTGTGTGTGSGTGGNGTGNGTSAGGNNTGTGSGTGTGTGSGSAGGTDGNGTGNGTNAGSNNAGNGSSAAVQTGDPAQTGVWGVLLLASLASIGYVASSQRRRRRSII